MNSRSISRRCAMLSRRSRSNSSYGLWFKAARALSLLAMLSLPVQSVRAATCTWDAGSSSDYAWDTLSNWVVAGSDPVAAPSATDDVVFVTPIPQPNVGLPNPEQVTLSGGSLANSITFNDSYTLSGGDLTLTSTGAGAVTVAAGKVATINTDILTSGALGLNLSAGTGTLALGGNNTFSGGITVGAASLSFGASNNLGDASATNALSVNGGSLIWTGGGADDLGANRTLAIGASGATINTAGAGELTISGVLSGAGALTKSGSGTLALSGTNLNSGAVAINGGILSVSDSAHLGDASATNNINFGGGTLRFTGGADLGATRTVTVGTGGGTIDTGANAVTISGVLTSASGNNLNKMGTGDLTLSGTVANTTSGAVNVSQGTLILNKTGVNALGSGGASINSSAAGAATLRLDAGDQIDNNATITLSADGGAAARFDLNGFNETVSGLVLTSTTLGSAHVATGAGVLTLNGTLEMINNRNAAGNTNREVFITGTGTYGTSTPSGTLDLGGAVRIFDIKTNNTQANNGATIETVIQNGGIIKAGNTALLLRNNNTFTGGLTINNNVVDFSADNNLGGAGNVITLGGGGVRYNNNAGLTFARTLNISAAAAEIGVVQAAGPLTIGTADLLKSTLATAITKSGAGTLTLNAANPNLNATSWSVTGGTLVAANRSALGTAAAPGVTVSGNSTARLFGASSTVASAGVNGLNAYYYNFGAGLGSSDNRFATEQLLAGRVVTRVDSDANTFNLPTSSYPRVPVSNLQVPDYLGMMWKGLLNVSTAGSYTFQADHDDNFSLYVDGQIVLADAGYTTTPRASTPVTLSAGAHSIVMKFTQGAGGRKLKAEYSGPDTSAVFQVLGSTAGTLTTGSLAPLAYGTVGGGGTMDIYAPSTATGFALGNGETFTLSSLTIDNLTITGASTINTATSAGVLAPTSGALIFNAGFGETTAGSMLTVAGPYLTQFNAANSYTGITTVTGGRLELNAAGGDSIAGNLDLNAANGSGLVSNVQFKQSNQIANTATVTVRNFSVLDLGANNDTIGALNVQGTGRIIGSGTLTTSGIAAQSGTVLANLAGTGGVIKTTAGRFVLGGTNTYAGLTDVQTGILAVRGNSLGATGAGNETTVAGGAQIQFQGPLTSGESITVQGTGVSAYGATTGAVWNLGGANTLTSNLLLAGDTTIRSDGGNLTLAGIGLNGPANANLNIDGNGEVTLNSLPSIGAGTVTKNGQGTLTYNMPLATFPTVTFNGGAIGFNGPQTWGAYSVPANRALKFYSDPTAGVSLTLNNSGVIAGYAADQNLLSRIVNTSPSGALLLGVDSANSLDFNTGGHATIVLGAQGNAKYSGSLTPNATSGYLLGVAPYGKLDVTSVLATNAAMTVGGTVQLSANNTFAGNITVSSGGQLEIINNQNLGAAANAITLNGGTLRLNLTSGNAGQLVGMLGNVGPSGSATRIITIGASGGTIEVPAQSLNNAGYALMGDHVAGGVDPLVLAGGAPTTTTLTKAGLGYLFMPDVTAYAGTIAIGTSGGSLDVRGKGQITSAARIIVNSGGQLRLENNAGLGSGRQATSEYLADRIANAIPIDLYGGMVWLRARNNAAQRAETFGTTTLMAGQSFIEGDREGQGVELTFSNLTRQTGSTVRFGGEGTVGTTGDNTRIFLTQVNGAAPIAGHIGGWATITGTDFVGYGANGATIANGTNQGAAAFTPAAGTIYNLNAAGNATLNDGAGSPIEMLALRFGNNAAQELRFTTATDTLYVGSGGILSDGSNQARIIGATALRGNLTAGPSSGASGTQELFLHNNSNTMTLRSVIIDNPNGGSPLPLAVVKDLDGRVDLDATNTYTGGTFVNRGHLVGRVAGAFGMGPVTARNSRVEFFLKNTIDATATTGGYTAVENGEIYLNGTGAFDGTWDRFTIPAGSILYGYSAAAAVGLNSLTRVAGAPTAGGQVQLAPDAIVGHLSFNNNDQNGIGANTIQNLGVNSDLYYGLSGDFNQALGSVTLGAGTPWKGMSTDRSNRRFRTGTIIANSDIYLQGLARDGGYSILYFGIDDTAGSFSFVNNAGRAINAYVKGQMILEEGSPVSMPNDMTVVVTAGSLLQPNRTNGLGNLEVYGSRANLVIQAGGTVDPGNYTPVNPYGDPTQIGKQYALPSPINTNVTVEAGGRLLINDASGIGSVTGGATWTVKSGGVLQLDDPNAFFGSENGLVKSSGSPFVFEPGAIVRQYDDDRIFKLDQFVSGATGGSGVIYQIANGDKNITEYLNPFVAAATGTPRVFGHDLTIGAGGGITNDASDRTVRNRRGTVYLGNGSMLAATSQTYLYMSQNFELLPNANVTIGSSQYIDGQPKLGTVRFNRENNSVGDNTTSLTLVDGTQILLDAVNVIPDSTSVHLPTPATSYVFPGNGPGTALVFNINGNTEFIGKLTGSGTVYSNVDTAALGVGWNASSDFTFDGAFKDVWGTGNNRDQHLVKVGPTRMTLTNTHDTLGHLQVYQGEVVLAGLNGKWGSSTTNTAQELRLSKGGTLTFDNTVNAVTGRFIQGTGGNDWLTTMGGGDFRLLGHATDVGDVLMFGLGSGSPTGIPSYTGGNSGGFGTVTVVPSGDLSTLRTSITFNQAENFQTSGDRSNVWLIRGVGVGGLPGTYSTSGVYTANLANPKDGLVFFNNPRFTALNGFDSNVGGTVIIGGPGSPVVPVRGDLLASADPNATHGEFATIDIVSGASRTGIRPLQASEYSNVGPNVGTNATVPLNVRAQAGATLNYSGDSRFQVLKMENGSALNVSGILPALTQPSQVILNGGGILVPAGATAAINAGSNNLFRTNGGVSAYVHALGNLNVDGEFFSDVGLIKTGPGTASFTDGSLNNLRGRIAVHEGTVSINDTLANVRDWAVNARDYGASSFNAISLELNGGTLNINGKDQFFGRFESGNILAGPTTEGGTLHSTAAATVAMKDGGTFSGHITGSISLRKFGNNTLFLTNTNSTVGTARVDQGTLSLRDSGTLIGVSQFDINFARLDLDNGWLAGVATRISPTATLNMRGGDFIVRGRAGSKITTSVGTVNALSGLNLVQSIAGGGGANETIIANLVRSPGAMVNFVQTNGFLGTSGDDSTAIRYKLTQLNGGAVTLSNNILPAWIIANGDHFATYDPTLGISYLSNLEDGFADYTTNDITAAAATATANVNWNNANRTLLANKTINALRVAPNAANTLTLGDATNAAVLTIASGGIITNNNNTWAVNNANAGSALTSGAGELFLYTNQNTTTYNTRITGSIAVNVAGSGTTKFQGPGNNYSGVTYALAGTGGGSARSGTLQLDVTGANGTSVVAVPGNLWIGSMLVSELQANQIAQTATVTLEGNGGLDLRDATGVTETLSALVFQNAGGDSSFRPIVSRPNPRAGSGLNLTAATPITSTNDNPTSTPLVYGNVGTLNFTRAGAQTLMVTSSTAPTSTGLTAAGLTLNAMIGTVPTGIDDGGLIKDGNGMLILTPVLSLTTTTTSGSANLTVPDTSVLAAGTPVTGRGIPAGATILSITNATTLVLSANATVSETNTIMFGQSNSFGNPGVPTEVFNIQSGLVRADFPGALGGNNAITTVQNGATLILDALHSLPYSGSLQLKNGSTLGMTISSPTLGAVGSAGTLDVPSGATTNIHVRDYFIPSSNAGNVIVNHKLTGAGNVNLVGIDYVAGYNGGGLFQLRNTANDFSGTINVNTNTVLEANSNTATGGTFGTAAINLNGGVLRVRDQGDNLAGAQTITYGNNVNLSANSYINFDRQGTVATTKTIAFGSLTVGSGARSLYVNNGNSFRASFTELIGPGTLVVNGNSALDIAALNSTVGTIPSITIGGPQGLNFQRSASALNLLSATNDMTNLTVNGGHIVAAGKTYGVSNTLEVGSNAGAVTNGMGYDAAKNLISVANGSVSGGLVVDTTASVTAATLKNYGLVGPTGGAATINATSFVGSGVYNAWGNNLTLNGTIANDGATPTTLKVTGTGSGAVVLPTVGHTFTGGVQVQTGALRVAPAASAVDPLPTAGTIRTYGQPVTALAANSQPIDQTPGTLEFAAGPNTITQNGAIVNNGAVRVSSGTVNLTSPLAGTNFASLTNLTDFESATVPGLLEGRFTTTAAQPDTNGSGRLLTAARLGNSGNFGVTLEPRMGQTNLVTQNTITGWTDNTTWIYTGYFYDADGKFSFAENIDDSVLISIDGVNRLLNNSGTNPYQTVTNTSTTAGQRGTTTDTTAPNTALPASLITDATPLANNPNLPAGWHTIEIRVDNGTGGGGPVGANGFFANYGIGFNPDVKTTLDGTQYFRPIDNGTGNLFRTAVYGKGNVQVDAAATLNVPQVTYTNKMTLGAAASGATANLNPATALASAVDALEVTGSTGTATLTTNANATLTVGNFTGAYGTTLTHNGAANRMVVTGTAAGGTINSTGAAGVTFNSNTTQSASTIITGSGGLIKEGTGTLTLSSTNTYSGPTQITAGTLKLGGGWGGTGSPFTNVPEASQFRTVYKLSIPNNPDFDTTIPYSENHSIDGTIGTGTFNRVAYFLELKKPADANSTWVWVSMDASPFTTDLTKMGIPTTANGAFFHYDAAGLLPGQVRNMNVATNAVSGVTAGTGITTGNVEFWPSNYGVGNDYAVPGANAGVYDFGDGGAGTTTGHGSMQIFNYATGEALFSMNRFNAGGANEAGIFIGNNTSTVDTDGTFVYNSASYSIKDLWVLVGNTGAGSSILPITTPVTIGDNAALDLNGNNQTIASLTGTALASVQLGSGTLTTGDATSTTFAGVISGAGSLVKTGSGTFTLSGANTHAGSTTVNQGTLRVDGSVATSTGVTVAGSATFTAGATQLVKTLDLSAASSNATIAAGAIRVLSVGDNTAASPLTLTGGKMDLNTSALIVDFTAGNEAANLTLVKNAIIAGRNAGAWNGTTGITSTAAAAASSVYGVGYAPGTVATAAIAGVTPDATSLVARYTRLGDANLDGAVNFFDLTALAAAYGAAGEWYNGDFDYSGDVNFFDLTALAANYGTGLPSEPIPGATPDFSADLAAAFASVPEPGAISLLGLAALALLKRRNNRKAA